MIRDVNVTVSLDTPLEEVVSSAVKKSGINPKAIIGYKIKKRSVDARRKQVQFNYCISLYTGKETEKTQEKLICGTKPMPSRPVIVGSGPAGLFCAYTLSKYGYNPILLERGKPVEQRIKAIDSFCSSGILDTQTNVQFGEGGAGTFSDGKLTTRINDKHCDDVLQIFTDFGAPEEIQYLAKPHIGTDVLRDVIVNMRNYIIENGGTVRFESCLDTINIKNNCIDSILVNGEEHECKVLVLATGHSSRDTYYMLAEKGVFMEPKAFAVGVRVEHSQDFINKAQYGDFAGHHALGAADYRLAYNGSERSCFSFCMCPGGYVVAAASEENTVVVNGMSNHARDGKNANSALVVNVTQNDYNGTLGGIEFQRQLERAAFDSKNPYYAPVQNTVDFIDGKVSKNTKTAPTYPIGCTGADLNTILPTFVASTLKDGLDYFDTRIKGFAKEGVLTGVETRTSAPVRITRNEEMESINVKGLFPIGEGAGYAGGIMSSAVDGIKMAKKIISAYKPF